MPRRTRQAIIRWAAGMLLALVVAYPLSYAPVSVAHDYLAPPPKGYVDPRDPTWREHDAGRKKIDAVYEPLFCVLRSSGAARNLHDRWFRMWNRLLRP